MLVSSVLATGCTSNNKISQVYAPNEQLDDILIKYAQVKTPTSTCKARLSNATQYPVTSEVASHELGCHENTQKESLSIDAANINLNCHDYSQPIVDCFRLASELSGLYLKYPNSKRIMMASALVEFEIGNTSNSQQLLDLILSKRGAYPEAAILRSRIAMEEGNLTLARTIVKRQLNITPYNPYLYELQAAYYYVEGNYNEALQALTSAEHFTDRNWKISYHRGLIYEAKKEWYKACKEYTSVLKVQPDNQMLNAKVLLLRDHIRCNISSI